jgi:hypothetical protein
MLHSSRRHSAGVFPSGGVEQNPGNIPVLPSYDSRNRNAWFISISSKSGPPKSLQHVDLMKRQQSATVTSELWKDDASTGQS